MKAQLYKKELSGQEYFRFLEQTKFQGYYNLGDGEKGKKIACWIVDEEWAKELGWTPCMPSEIKKYKDLYEEPLNELEEVAIKRASKAAFDRVRENLNF